MRSTLPMLLAAAAAHAGPLEERLRWLEHPLPLPDIQLPKKADDAGPYDILSVEMRVPLPEPGALPDSAEYTVRIEAVEPLDRISLVALGFDAVDVTVDGGPAPYVEDELELSIDSGPVPPGGVVELHIAARLGLRGCGPEPGCADGVEFPHVGDATLVPLSTAFPLNDRFDLSLVFVGDSVVPAGSGVGGPAELENGRTVWRYESVFPTVLPAMSFGAYAVDPRGPSRFFTPAGARAGADWIAHWLEDARGFYSELLGPFPFEQVDVAALDDRAGVAIGPQALALFPVVFWRAAGLDVEESLVRQVAAHELAHQYFFNQIAIVDPGEGWLSEGFAEYAAVRHSEHATGTRAHYDENYWGYVLTVGPREDVPVRSRAVDDSAVRTQVLYLKGSTVLHQLHARFGERFDAAIRAYVAELSGQIATTDELQEILERELGEPLDAFFDDWIYGAGFPEVVVRVEPAREDRDPLIVRVEQQPNPHGPFRGPVPLRIHREDADPATATATLEGGALQVQLPDAQGIEVDPERTFFRRIRAEPAGDVNLDGVVDGMDLLDAHAAAGRFLPSSEWLDQLDVNDDQTIDDRDVRQIVATWGAGW